MAVVIIGNQPEPLPDLDFSRPRTKVVRAEVDPFRAEKTSWTPGSDEIAAW